MTKITRHPSRTVRPDRIFQGSICYYDFRSDVRGELNGPRPVVIIGRQPGMRMLRKLDIQVVPLSTAPAQPGRQDISVGCNGGLSRAILDEVTTINPDRLRDYMGCLSSGDLRAVKAGVLSRFESVKRNSTGLARHFKPGHILLVPTDRAPDGRQYVVLDNRRTPLAVDNIQMMTLVAGDPGKERNCRLRSFSRLRGAHLKPRGKLDEAGVSELRGILGHRLDLPSLIAASNP